MDIFPLLELISFLFVFMLVIFFFWRVSKLKPPQVVYLLDFVCYKSPFTKTNAKNELENRLELYTSPNGVENVVFEMVDELLNKITAYVKNIGVLVCVFNGSSTVSLSSMIMKKYKLQEDIASYDLNEKGCNSGFVAITLAKQLLKTKRDCYALVLITEQHSEGRHVSTDSSMPQCLPSGAAILLSNRSSDFPYSKYKLVGTHNAHLALSTNSSSSSHPSKPGTQDYNPGTQEPEPGTHTSVSDPEIQVIIADPGTKVDASNPGTQTHVSGDAKLVSEQVVRSNVAFTSSLIQAPRRHRFSMCQVSGDPMVGAAERSRNMASHNTGASRTVLSRFGYEPITSLWYRFDFIDANVKRFDEGDCVSQMAFWSDLSDFKGSTLIWEATRDTDGRANKIKPMICKLFGDSFSQFLSKC